MAADDGFKLTTIDNKAGDIHEKGRKLEAQPLPQGRGPWESESAKEGRQGSVHAGQEEMRVLLKKEFLLFLFPSFSFSCF
jgi:hypothetical protein